ncbi:MAG: VWA domain-containing protein, partial [Deltaproteobacteria bacterium]|nr:VWA domain-containing protein [Deltaproteobacteria bacterium]
RLQAVVTSEELAELEDLWLRLSRLVKVARLLAGHEEGSREELCAPLPEPRRRMAQDPRVLISELLVARACGVGPVHERRRDLRLAHELLLRASDPGSRRRIRELRLEAGRLRRDMADLRRADPLRAVARAAREGDGNALWEAAVQTYRHARRQGDAPRAAAARRLVAALEPRMRDGLAQAIARDDAAGLERVAGTGALSELQRDAGRDRLAELVLGLDPLRWTSFDIAAEAGIFFDVEEATASDEEQAPEQPPPAPLVRVPYPSAHMAIETARGIEELPHFVIGDPRLVLYDLASQRQLVRAHFAPQELEPPKAQRGAVRVYVLDASGSMDGARARFRDAILMAELNNLTVRAGQGRPFAPIYFAFFNDAPSDLCRVDSPAQAVEQIEKLFGRSRGETDITLALLSAFAAIRDARGRNPELGRATVVLVTDGQDRVDAEAIEAARTPVGELEITLSFIALGRENRDLRELVLQQREAGKRAFYYFLDDEEVAGARGLFDTGPRTLLPEKAQVDFRPDDPELQQALAALLALDGREQGPEEAGPAPRTRFEAFFPARLPQESPGATCLEEAERCAGCLEAVAETVALAPAEIRDDEAVLLLEHLLRAYGMPVPSYLSALAGLPEKGRAALERIRVLSRRLPQPTTGSQESQETQ